MRNKVRTPPISTTELASRGNPFRSCPTSVEVPPTSMTIASARPDKNAAPRIELVAPEAKLITGKARSHRGWHHSPVILRQIERRGDPACLDRRSKACDCRVRDVDQRSIEEGGVLAFKKTDATELVRCGDRGIWALFAKDGPCPLFPVRVERGKDRGDRDRADAALADLPRNPSHAGLVERHDRAAVVVVPAFEHEHGAADPLGEVQGPVAEWRQ